MDHPSKTYKDNYDSIFRKSKPKEVVKVEVPKHETEAIVEDHKEEIKAPVTERATKVKAIPGLQVDKEFGKKSVNEQVASLDLMNNFGFLSDGNIKKSK